VGFRAEGKRSLVLAVSEFFEEVKLNRQAVGCGGFFSGMESKSHPHEGQRIRDQPVLRISQGGIR
jgi:hypothetical protein